MSSNLEVAKQYLKTLEDVSPSSSIGEFFDPDFVQIEYPNRLNPNGGRSELKTASGRFERGKQMIREQHYDIQNAMELGNQVALEVLWTATLAVPVGTLPAGSSMSAHFAVFLEFRDGKIVAQRNYDCFEPF